MSVIQEFVVQELKALSNRMEAMRVKFCCIHFLNIADFSRLSADCKHSHKFRDSVTPGCEKIATSNLRLNDCSIKNCPYTKRRMTNGA